MKKSIALMSAAAALSVATAAGAATQGTVKGTVTLTGLVNNSCEVTAGDSSGSFSTVIPLGELDQANGTLRPDLQASTLGSPSASYGTTITCNTLSPQVEVTASELIDSGILTVPTGYANAVNYTASAKLTETTGSDTFTVTTNGSTDGHTGPTTVTNPIANTTDNLLITAYDFNTVGGNTNILLSSGGVAAYQGVITINITPNAAG